MISVSINLPNGMAVICDLIFTQSSAHTLSSQPSSLAQVSVSCNSARCSVTSATTCSYPFSYSAAVICSNTSKNFHFRQPFVLTCLAPNTQNIIIPYLPDLAVAVPSVV